MSDLRVKDMPCSGHAQKKNNTEENMQHTDQSLYWKSRIYRVLINYCVFPRNILILLNSVSSAAALVFHLAV